MFYGGHAHLCVCVCVERERERECMYVCMYVCREESRKVCYLSNNHNGTKRVGSLSCVFSSEKAFAV